MHPKEEVLVHATLKLERSVIGAQLRRDPVQPAEISIHQKARVRLDEGGIRAHGQVEPGPDQLRHAPVDTVVPEMPQGCGGVAEVD